MRVTSDSEWAAGARVGVLARAGKRATLDDFGVGSDGTVFVSIPTGFEVRRIAEGGGDGVFVDDGRIVHPSSVQLGRYGRDVVLYVTTDGALKGLGVRGADRLLEFRDLDRKIPLRSWGFGRLLTSQTLSKP